MNDAWGIDEEGWLLRDGGSYGLKEEEAQDSKHDEEFDEDDDPQLPAPRHLPETIEVEIKDSAQEVHGFQRRREGKSYLLLR